MNTLLLALQRATHASTSDGSIGIFGTRLIALLQSLSRALNLSQSLGKITCLRATKHFLFIAVRQGRSDAIAFRIDQIGYAISPTALLARAFDREVG